MSVTLVLPDFMASDLCSAAKAPVETAGVLLARAVITPAGNLRLLGRDLRWVAEDAYLLRQPEALTIASRGYVPALAVAEAESCVPIWFHTHPGDGASPRPSLHDEIVDEQLHDLFRLRSGSPYYASLVFSHRNGSMRFAGHVEVNGRKEDIARLWITGRRFHLIQNALHEHDDLPSKFDRSIRAFGGAVQFVLGDLRVAVVGAGGTGSSVAEQLVRLGVRHLQLFDPDTLSESNLTRVYGSFPDRIGSKKVDIVAEHLHRIAPDARIDACASMITVEETARALLEADVIFGCTDDNGGRLVLSRAAAYLLTPVIDCGVLLSSDKLGKLEGIDGRVTVMAPGLACLVCRGRIDLERAAVEMLTPDEHRRLADEGYAPALPGVEPAVVAYTTLVAAAAVGELLERLVHYGAEPAPSELLLRLHERDFSTNDQEPRDRHYCHPSRGRLGLGLTEPFLDRTWQS